MVDQDAHPGRLQNRGHVEELVAFHLHVGEHVQLSELAQQRTCVTEVFDAKQRGLHRGAHDAAVAEPLQFGAAGVGCRRRRHP